MPKIVISYRREDSQAITGRIRDRLAAEYGEKSVFMDIDSVPAGTPFIDEIRRHIQGNEILLAIIGPKWLGLSDSGSRIQDKADPVHVEMATAFDREARVIPVLVNDAKLPTEQELPEDLRQLRNFNAASVDNGQRFHHDVSRLIRSIERDLTAKEKVALALRRFPYRYALYALVAIMLSRLIFLEHSYRSGSLGRIDEFFSCGARVLYPSAAFSETDKVVDGDSIRTLMHAQGEAVARLYSSHVKDNEQIVTILNAIAAGTMVSYRRVQADEYGILTGWHSTAQGAQEEYYYRLQTTAEIPHRYILYEMIHPPKPEPTHPYWNLNEIISRTLLSKGSLTNIPKSCDFRRKLMI